MARNWVARKRPAPGATRRLGLVCLGISLVLGAGGCGKNKPTHMPDRGPNTQGEALTDNPANGQGKARGLADQLAAHFWCTTYSYTSSLEASPSVTQYTVFTRASFSVSGEGAARSHITETTIVDGKPKTFEHAKLERYLWKVLTSQGRERLYLKPEGAKDFKETQCRIERVGGREGLFLGGGSGSQAQSDPAMELRDCAD